MRIDGDGTGRLMYELAMGSDGFWRWGMRAWGTYERNAFALANLRPRQVESRLGDDLVHGKQVAHFVSVREHTGERQGV